MSPIVVVPKSSGQVRLCVDMQEANNTVKHEKHLMRTTDDLVADLNGATIFSKLHLSFGYHQLELEPERRHITTLGSLSKRTFQGDAVVKSAKARDSRRRSRAKFSLLSTDATQLGGLHSQIIAYLIPLSLLWHVLKSFVSLISNEDYM